VTNGAEDARLFVIQVAKSLESSIAFPAMKPAHCVSEEKRKVTEGGRLGTSRSTYRTKRGYDR
jgi:hypothetical protein